MSKKNSRGWSVPLTHVIEIKGGPKLVTLAVYFETTEKPAPARNRPLPSCPAILNAIGNLLTDRCQVEEFLFAEDIFGFFGKLPIHGRLLSEIVIPVHDS